MTHDDLLQSQQEAGASLKASGLIVRAQHGLSALTGATMHDNLQSAEAAGLLSAMLAKFLPASLGAAVMIAVDLPKTKRELFARLFVAFVASVMLGDLVFDFLHSLAWFSFLDAHKRAHTGAVDFIVGGLGWFLIGGAAMWARKFKADPAAAVAQVKP